ncbi:MAG: VWA domain-containing protein [Syntrophales bacterium]
MSLSSVVGQDEAKLALILNAIDSRCGGVIFIGEKGSGKTVLARSFSGLAGEDRPFVELPLNATEDALLGSIDLEETLATGTPVRQPGLLGRADGGVLYIDDVNLLSPEILALIMKEQTDCILIASMNPEEGALSAHLLDRFGMCVSMGALKKRPDRIAVMKQAMDLPATGPDSDLRDELRNAGLRLEGVCVPPEILDYIARLCTERFIAGHRGDIHLLYAARAYAALSRAEAVDMTHVDAVAPLVLAHRGKCIRELDEEAPGQEREHSYEEEKDHQDRLHGKKQPEAQQEGGEDSGGPENNEVHRPPPASATAEEIFGVGADFKVKRLTFRKDRMNRAVPGRRTKTGSCKKRGRNIKSILRDNKDIAVDATIRAAAPFQRLRGRKEMLLIRIEDLRYKQREKRMGHLVIFVVDGSGSMGVRRRMIETKGAIQSLLMDCYQKREMVSMIVFRKDRAEIVLPPTASIELASKRLKEIPVGGKTPLTAGLLEAFNLIKHVRIKSAETRFLVVVITDGRANHSLSGAPVHEEIKKVTGLMRSLPATDYLIVDTEDKTKIIRTDLAREIASALKGDYFEMDHLKADYLAGVVREKKALISFPLAHLAAHRSSTSWIA